MAKLIGAAAVILFGGLSAQALPLISNIHPSGAVQFQPSASLTFTVSSSVGVAPSAITVQLIGATLPGPVFAENLTTANGLVVTGTSTSESVSAPLTSNLVYTATIQVTDANENTTNLTVNFDTINPAYTFEAEDWDYSLSSGTSGLFIDNPQTNAYANLNSKLGYDYNNPDYDNGQDGGEPYRPQGLETEQNGDKPRLAYSAGKADYDVGYNNGGNWGNYTRTFPAGVYNIYMRVANPNGATADAASMSLVAGRGTASETTTTLGTFLAPDTGSWQTYSWSPLLDTNGNLVQFTGGAVETLRVTTVNGSYNANFYLLMPANLSVPVITNLFPDGSSFFQYTNQLTFLVSSTAGILTNDVIVILDGVNVSNLLSLTGSLGSWHVTCPLTVNTNHSVVISVAGNNGVTATRTFNINDFPSTNYQWEAEDYDYDGGKYFDNPQTDAYAGLPSITGADNYEADPNANPFIYRSTNGPSTTVANDEQRPQFFGKTDYSIGFFGNGSWVNYTRHYPVGTYYVWGRFAEGSTATEVTISQLTSGYGTSLQTSNSLGTFYVPDTGGWSTWGWSILVDAAGNPLKVRFDDSQQTLQLNGTPVASQPEVNANFLMLVPTAPDPFVVEQTLNNGLTNVQILYSKPVAAASATNIANYVFMNGTTVTSATLTPDNMTVVLTTSPLVDGSNYTIVINDVQDRMNLPNTIATNTVVMFQALPYTLDNIGHPPVLSSGTVAGNGLNITAVGSGFGSTNDQGNLSFQLYSGNFDVAVRVADLTLSGIFAQAGLMAREELTSAGRFAASFTTPSMNGSFFEWRDPVGSIANKAGKFSANYPNTWLRLQRVGNTFTGYAGYDGQTWTQLGSDTISMSNQIYLGFAVSSDTTNPVTTAEFRDFTNVTSAVIGAQINPHDAIGPSARTTPIAFSEIMWKPAPRTDG
ncbi:MAG: carbohydrate-binding protein, partial [Verrucomicrobiota bacterium]